AYAEDTANINADTNPTVTPATPAEVITTIEAKPLHAEAGPDKNVAIGRNVLFDASASTGPSEQALNYVWDFGDGQSFQGIDASHIYKQPGVYKAKLTVSDGINISRDYTLVTVAREVMLLVTDDSVAKTDIKQLKQTAKNNGILLVSVKPTNTATTNYTLSQSIAEQLVAASDDLNQAKTILIWTNANVGLTALTETERILSSSNDEKKASTISFKQKTIVRVDEHPTSVASGRLVQSTYNTLQPNYILLTTSAALDTLLANSSDLSWFEILQNQNIPYQIISSHSQRALDSITFFNFTSYGINYLINQGVSQDTLFLLLVLPVVATLIAFARQVVGVKAFGIYVPSIITLTFVVTQLKYGLVIFAVLLAAATMARIGLRYLKLLYLPRMALVMSLVAFTIFIMFIMAGYFKQTGFLAISVFPILVMIILTEKFVEAQIEQGNKSAIILTLETFALSVISYFIITWSTFETLMLAYPEIIIGSCLLLNVLLGRFSGLRVLEYFRFRKLLKQ
ncbi:MAG: 7TM domain-containing protein, partial [Patescibacteria group bacterium]